jgi:hypothetical protein
MVLLAAWALLVTGVPAADPSPTHVTTGERTLMFPYQVVEGSAAKDGLWEDHTGKPISRAKPVLLEKGLKVTQLKTVKVKYAGRGDNGADAEL